MSAVRNIHHILNIRLNRIKQYELSLTEAFLLNQLYNELKRYFKEKYSAWRTVLKLNVKEENMLLNSSVLRFIIEDTLSTGTYDLQGIAYYTYQDIEIIEDLLLQRNSRPSINLLQRIIDLHQSVRPELYTLLKKNILSTLSNHSEESVHSNSAKK